MMGRTQYGRVCQRDPRHVRMTTRLLPFYDDVYPVSPSLLVGRREPTNLICETERRLVTAVVTYWMGSIGCAEEIHA